MWPSNLNQASVCNNKSTERIPMNEVLSDLFVASAQGSERNRAIAAAMAVAAQRNAISAESKAMGTLAALNSISPLAAQLLAQSAQSIDCRPAQATSPLAMRRGDIAHNLQRSLLSQNIEKVVACTPAAVGLGLASNLQSHRQTPSQDLDQIDVGHSAYEASMMVDHTYVDYTLVEESALHKIDEGGSPDSMNRSAKASAAVTSLLERYGRTVRPRNSGGVAKPFPERLMEVLDKPEHADVIGWRPHGRAFLVKNPKVFTSEVLPCNFKQSHFTSFTRQLNLWGFKRITRGRDAGSYYHELFLRGRKQLAKRIRRQKLKGTGIKLTPNPDAEPNFYNFPAVTDKTSSLEDDEGDEHTEGRSERQESPAEGLDPNSAPDADMSTSQLASTNKADQETAESTSSTSSPSCGMGKEVCYQNPDGNLLKALSASPLVAASLADIAAIEQAKQEITLRSAAAVVLSAVEKPGPLCPALGSVLPILANNATSSQGEQLLGLHALERLLQGRGMGLHGAVPRL